MSLMNEAQYFANMHQASIMLREQGVRSSQHAADTHSKAAQVHESLNNLDFGAPARQLREIINLLNN